MYVEEYPLNEIIVESVEKARSNPLANGLEYAIELLSLISIIACLSDAVAESMPLKVGGMA